MEDVVTHLKWHADVYINVPAGEVACARRRTVDVATPLADVSQHVAARRRKKPKGMEGKC